MVEKRSKGRSELTIEKLYHHLDHYIDVLRLHNAVLLYLVLVLVLKLYLSTFFSGTGTGTCTCMQSTGMVLVLESLVLVLVTKYLLPRRNFVMLLRRCRCSN